MAWPPGPVVETVENSAASEGAPKEHTTSVASSGKNSADGPRVHRSALRVPHVAGYPLPRCGKTGHNGAAMSAITIRAARPGDARRIAQLDVETWRAAYAGILATPFLVGLSAPRREVGWAAVIEREPRDVRVAVNGDGEIVGFGSCGRNRDSAEHAGEVFTLYVAPDWQNQGIGRALLLALFERLVAQGAASALIWVLRDNPARYFYRRLGGREVRQKSFRRRRQADRSRGIRLGRPAALSRNRRSGRRPPGAVTSRFSEREDNRNVHRRLADTHLGKRQDVGASPADPDL